MRRRIKKASYLFLVFYFAVNAYGGERAVFSIDEKTLQTAQKLYGKAAKERLVNLVKLLNKIYKKPERGQLEAINDFFNGVPFATDMQVWHVEDYWATRREFLDKGRGDCEDYVIAKYFSLLQLGISEEKLYLTYVKAIKYRQSHMVMTYYPNQYAVPLVLDNINPKILPATSRKDLWPLFSFNGKKIFLAKRRAMGKVIPFGKANLKHWSELILKIKKEGL